MVDAAQFWDRMSAKYAALAISDPEAYAHTLGRTRHHLNAQTRALEIGCGTGTTALDLAGDVQVIYGSDVSPRMIDIARDKAVSAAQNAVQFEVGTAAEALAVPRDINAVLAFNILHLLDDMPSVLAQIHARLQAGDLFISKTPCIMDRSVGIKRFAIRAAVPALQLIGKAPALNYLTIDALETAITDAGFEILETCSRPQISRYIVARKP